MSAIGSAKSVKLGLASNPESSSNWVKTLIDPAHAREYGCRGIPDENQQPTLVLNGRETYTYTSDFNTGTGSTQYFIKSGTTWTRLTDGIYQAHWNELYIVMLGLTRAYVTIYKGWGSSTVTGAVNEAMSVNWVDNMTSTSGNMSRLVAQSATVDWVAQEINRAGYYEAGYLLPKISDHSTSNYMYCDLRLDDIPNLTTYTGNAEDGCYIVATFNDYDTYRYWKGRKQVQMRVRLDGIDVNVGDVYSEYVNPQGFGGMRPYFIHYVGFTTNNSDATALNPWGLRVTTNQVVETMAPYNAGGSDAAVYDRASVEDMISLYDAVDLIFPASYNDWKKVWGWIKSNSARLPSFAASVMRHFPQTRSLGNALGALIGDEVSLHDAIDHLKRSDMPGYGPNSFPNLVPTNSNIQLAPNARMATVKPKRNRNRNNKKN